MNSASAQLRGSKGNTEPAFVLRDVTVQFGQQTPVLKDLSFQVESGQFLALVGPSGCGKSTILRLFADLLGPVAGTVSRRSDVGAGQIGFVFQQPNLLPWRTGLQNLQLPSELGHSIKEDRSERELLELMRQVGLKDSDQDKRPAEMSGGMQMRLSLARALVNEPRILLLDEPFAAVDDLLRMKLQEDVRRIHDDRNLTTILVTHNLHEAAYLSDRVLVLSSAPAMIRQDLQLERTSMTAEQRRTTEETMRSLQQLTGALFQP